MTSNSTKNSPTPTTSHPQYPSSDSLDSSILIFDINRKNLLFKILNAELKALIIRKWKELNSNDEEEASEDAQDTPEAPNELQNVLSNDYIYSFFSPLISSYEISKEMDHTYEYMVFEEGACVAKFNQFDNCLMICLYSMKNCIHTSEKMRQLCGDFYASWCCKSIISLIKYKFAICTVEHCFATHRKEVKQLYLRWHSLRSKDLTNYFEGIEVLQLNDEIKQRYENFIKEIYKLILEQNTQRNDTDDSASEKLDISTSEDDEDSTSEDEAASIQSSDTKSVFKSDYVKEFTKDQKQIQFALLTYGTKLVFKHEFNKQSDNYLDSSSLFMILLEAASLCRLNAEDSTHNDTNAPDELSNFKTPTVSPSIKSIEENDAQLSTITEEIEKSANIDFGEPKSGEEIFQSVESTISKLTSTVFQTPFVDDFHMDKLTEKDEAELDLNSEKDDVSARLNFDDKDLIVKKSSCFLKTKNGKSMHFYELLFIQLDKNLFMVLLKQMRPSRYCEIATDLDEYLNELSVKLAKKRLFLISAESSSTVEDNSALNNSFDSMDDIKFLGMFINKLLESNDKFQLVRNDLNFLVQQNLKKSISDSQINGLQKKSNNLFRFDVESNFPKLNIRRKRAESKSRLNFNLGLKSNDDAYLQSLLSVIKQIQMKINQLSDKNNFNATIKLGSSSQLNELIKNLRNMEVRINSLKENLKEFLFKLLLIDENELNKRLPSNGSVVTGIHELFVKANLDDYTQFIDIKSRCNATMSWYSYKLPGLVHFSFINRQDNTCVVPAVDLSSKYNYSSETIQASYRKYYPVVITLLYKNDCVQFQFADKAFGIIFNYFIWFEDKSANYIPVDLNTRIFESNEKASNEPPGGKPVMNYFNRKPIYPPGITLQSYYDHLKRVCYPNAPTESLYCFELMCIHSIQMDENKVNDQCERLVEMLTDFRKIK